MDKVDQVIERLDGKETVATVASNYSDLSHQCYSKKAELEEALRQYHLFHKEYGRMKSQLLELGEKLKYMLDKERKDLGG